MVTAAGPLQDTVRGWWWRGRRRFGRLGMLGLALLGTATALLAALPAMDRAVEHSRLALQSRRDALAASAPSAVPVPSEREQLDRFVGAFPPLSQNARDMNELFNSASQAHVALTKGDYALRTEAGSPFVVYTVTLPLRDGYPAIKAFAAEVLRTLPHASLDELRVARNDAGDATLDASLRFTLVYRRR